MGPVTFFVPAYNCAATLSHTVTSIFDGNHRDGDEVVIVNDGSTDGTAGVVRHLQEKYASIRAHAHRHNRGGGAARNTAVEQARNDILFCLDSDNILAPRSVPELVKFMAQTGADVASFGELHYFVADPGEVTHKWIFRPGQVTFADYLAGAIVPGASGNYLFTRESWLRARGYPESAGALDAWGFGLRQLGTGQKMMVMPHTHYHHRYGHESYWVRESRKGRTSLTALQLLIPFLDELAAQDVDYIMSPRGRLVWFDDLDLRPLRVKSGVRGKGGIVEDSRGAPAPAVGLARRLASAVARRFGAR